MRHVANLNRCRTWTPTLVTIVVLTLAYNVHARSSDRNEPMNLRSDHSIGTLEDNSTTVLTGNVIITQGTLDLRAVKADIQIRGGEPVRAVLTGKQVVMKQLLDDGSPMTAIADRIEYDIAGNVLVLIGNYSISTPRGNTRGQRLTYDLKNGKIESGGQGNGPVTMTIQPKSKQLPKSSPAPAPAPVKKPN